MAKVNLVNKKVQMSRNDIIRYQLLTHCFINSIIISNSELKCLTLLGIYNNSELTDFCKLTVEKGIFKTPQTVRNFLTKAEKNGLIIKKGTNKKKVQLLPLLKIQTKGTIVLDYKLAYIVTEEK